MEQARTAAPETEEKNGNGKWLILFTVIIGTFLGRLDQTIVNLALPKIIDDFSITVSAAGWIATAYILANAVFVPVWGKLGDTIGRKKVYVIGFLVFIFGSVLAGFAWNLSSMIIFRVIQAVAASADYPTAMAIIAFTFRHGRERAQALGLWSTSFAAAAVFGPLLGGPLIDNFGWRSVFLINLPVGLIGIFMALAFVPESKSSIGTRKFDWWGAITLGGALSSLVLVLDRGIDWGWLSLNSILAYFSIAVFGAIFYYIEKNHEEPIVDFKFFRNSIFVNTLANNFVIFMGMMGSIFLIPIFAATFLGLDATQTGYLFIPMALMMVIASPIGGSLTGKVKPHIVIFASTLVASIGVFLFSFLDPRSGPINIIIPLSIMAFGMGFGMAQRTNIIASVVPPHEMGVASAILALARNIAGAFGIAIFGSVLNSATESKVLEIARYSTLNIKTPENYAKYMGLITLKAQIAAYNTVFFIAAVLLFIGTVTALRIKVEEKKIDEPIIVEG